MIPLFIYSLHIPILALFGFLSGGLSLLLMNVESEKVATEGEGQRGLCEVFEVGTRPGVSGLF